MNLDQHIKDLFMLITPTDLLHFLYEIIKLDIYTVNADTN